MGLLSTLRNSKQPTQPRPIAMAPMNAGNIAQQAFETLAKECQGSNVVITSAKQAMGNDYCNPYGPSTEIELTIRIADQDSAYRFIDAIRGYMGAVNTIGSYWSNDNNDNDYDDYSIPSDVLQELAKNANQDAHYVSSFSEN